MDFSAAIRELIEVYEEEEGKKIKGKPRLIVTLQEGNLTFEWIRVQGGKVL